MNADEAYISAENTYSILLMSGTIHKQEQFEVLKFAYGPSSLLSVCET